MTSEQSLTRDEAADLLTNELLAAVEQHTNDEQGEDHAGTHEMSQETMSPVSPPSPPPPAISPNQLSAILAQQPDLSESEAARALAVSRAVKVLRAKRGCSAAEAIDELSGIMADVCKIRNKSGMSSPVRFKSRMAAAAASTAASSLSSSSLPPNPLHLLSSPPLIKKRRDFGGVSGLSRITPTSSRVPFTPVPGETTSNLNTPSTTSSSTLTTPASAPPSPPRLASLKQPRSLKPDLLSYSDDLVGGYIPGGKLLQHRKPSNSQPLTKVTRRGSKINRTMSPVRRGKRGGEGEGEVRSPKKRSRTISSEEGGFESP